VSAVVGYHSVALPYDYNPKKRLPVNQAESRFHALFNFQSFFSFYAASQSAIKDPSGRKSFLRISVVLAGAKAKDQCEQRSQERESKSKQNTMTKSLSKLNIHK
jgi:hypothetical protein